ncbi:MAG: hypothetical protein CVU77_07135 [Elusimicrobia bacterium HGW-Elusimicrobia-1]|nr:MAG: hypothetical protein CVU77_07135 [Elusimicrobia bacterium HGW-Elusimicrobia-1]
MKIDNFVNFGVQKSWAALFFAAAAIFSVTATSVRAAPMAGGDFSVDVSQTDSAAASRHLRDSVIRGYGAMHSAGATHVSEITGGGYELQAGFEHYDFGPEYFRSVAIKRGGDFAFGFNEDAVWNWEVPAVTGRAATVDVYIRLGDEYGSAAQKPSVTLKGPGVNASATATAAAFTQWEKLTVGGTPSADSSLILATEGFSRNEGARFYTDDIAVAQD